MEWTISKNLKPGDTFRAGNNTEPNPMKESQLNAPEYRVLAIVREAELYNVATIEATGRVGR